MDNYSCACPDNLVLDEGGKNCECMVSFSITGFVVHFISCIVLHLVPPFLLFGDSSYHYVRRINFDGSGLTTLTYLGSYYGAAVDFDYRYC